MRRYIFLLALAVNCISFSHSQQGLEQRLLDEELNYFAATSDSMRSRCVLNKINLLLAENVVNERLFFEIKRLQNAWVLESEKSNLYWNIALATYLMDEYYYFGNYINRYVDLEGESVETHLVRFLSVSQRDSLRAVEQLTVLVKMDSSLLGLEKVLKPNLHESRFKGVIRTGSILLPGSGLMLLKKPVQGLTSLGLNTATFFAVRYLLANTLYINSIGWGLNLVQRFYLGGISLTEKMIGEKEGKEKAHLANLAEDALNIVLDKYPLEFKLNP